jgi:hypothetical protein
LKQRFIPLEKQAKRKQRAYYTAQRKDWGDVNPITRATPNPKAYNRKKSGQWFEHEPSPDFYFSDVYSADAYIMAITATIVFSTKSSGTPI